MNYRLLALALTATVSLHARTPIPDDIKLGPARVHLHLDDDWQIEQFAGPTPRIVYSVDDAKLGGGTAQFQIIRAKMPRLDDRSSLASIADQLILKGKIEFSKLVFGEKVVFRRANDFVTRTNNFDVYWFDMANRFQLKRRGRSYACVGVVFTKDLFTQGVVYIITGFELNDGRAERPRHFDMLTNILEGLSIATP